MTDQHLCTCGQPAPTTTLCGDCLDQLHHDLDSIGDALTQLDIQLTRQARTAAGVGSRAADRPLPYDPRAAETLDLLRSVLVGWTRDTLQTRHNGPYSHGTPEPDPEYPPDRLDALAAFLRWQDWSVHPAADQFADELHYALSEVTPCIDTPPERRYLGPCGSIDHDGNECAGDVLKIGGRLPRCTDCRAVHQTDERLAWIADLAADQLVTATTAAGALSAWGEHIRPDLVRSWAARGRLMARGHDRAGHPLYLFADCRLLAVATLKRRSRSA